MFLSVLRLVTSGNTCCTCVLIEKSFHLGLHYFVALPLQLAAAASAQLWLMSEFDFDIQQVFQVPPLLGEERVAWLLHIRRCRTSGNFQSRATLRLSLTTYNLSKSLSIDLDPSQWERACVFAERNQISLLQVLQLGQI